MRCFVIRGFGEKTDAKSQRIDFESVHQALIKPALEACELAGDTTVEIVGAGSIHQDMFQLILKADVVICDITVNNPNVFYELGVRHALRKKHTVLIKGKESADATPFDISGARYTGYSVANPAASVPELIDVIRATLARDRVTDSPVFLMMPALPEAQVESVVMVPLDFVEEVQLAEAGGDKGWLRLLAGEVRGQTFEREGLRLIGRAQWALNDVDPAIETWETVCRGADSDQEGNLALANLYERLYRRTLKETWLELSNQAIRRVLARVDLSPAQRSEAMALQGRNLKSAWRMAFRQATSVAQRREQALNGNAVESYKAYKAAYFADFNNFFAGLAALQMGHILKSFAGEPDFPGLFNDGTRDTERFVEDLQDDLKEMATIVRAAVQRAKTAEKGDTLIWARISEADLQFLGRLGDESEANSKAVVRAYRNAIPKTDARPKDSFFWDAARGQLTLFEQLGIGVPFVQAVIGDLGGGQPSVPKGHLVVFSGYTVDRTGPQAPGVPRFPGSVQQQAGAAIREALEKLKSERQPLTVLASAAPGADILALEACKALGIESWLCLPLERDAVAGEVFQHYDDDWRKRFFTLANAQPSDRTFVMSHTGRLPDWLGASGMTPWSRGNRWMLLQAQAWGAQSITLLAFCDDSAVDHSDTGTAEIVRQARKDGNYDVRIIDSKLFLAG